MLGALILLEIQCASYQIHISGRNRFILAESPLPLGGSLTQDMGRVSVTTLEIAGTALLNAFGGGFVSSNFWHGSNLR